MNIAVYKEQRYEFVRGNDGEIILLSNTWQQSFEVETIDDMEFYAKHIKEDEADALWETKVALSLEEDAPLLEIKIIDAPTGDIVEFVNPSQLPDEVKASLKDNKIYVEKIRELYPEMSLWKTKKDYYDGSICSVPITLMEGINNSVKITKVSAKETILECGNCGFHFPYSNTHIAFGEVYSTNCPICEAEIVKKRV